MEPRDISLPPIIDIDTLGLDAGAHLLIKHGLNRVPIGGEIIVTGRAPGWDAQLAAWCRTQGHPVTFSTDSARITRSAIQAGRWRDALSSRHADATRDGTVHEHAHPRYGLAARGATVEAGCGGWNMNRNSAPGWQTRLRHATMHWRTRPD